MKSLHRSLFLALLSAVAVGASSAHAAIIYTGVSTTKDGAVDATATFSLLSPTQLQVVLTNVEDSASQGQSISGLTFTFSGFTITGLASGLGDIEDFNVATPAITPAANILDSGIGNWTASKSGSTETMSTLGGGQPLTLITSVTGTPNGNPKNFEPFVIGSGTFVFTISGTTPNAAIGTANFNFGTSAGEGTATGTPSPHGSLAPEPASLGLLSAGAASLLLRRRKR